MSTTGQPSSATQAVDARLESNGQQLRDVQDQGCDSPVFQGEKQDIQTLLTRSTGATAANGL
jgi:hypothetical protein